MNEGAGRSGLELRMTCWILPLGIGSWPSGFAQFLQLTSIFLLLCSGIWPPKGLLRSFRENLACRARERASFRRASG